MEHLSKADYYNGCFVPPDAASLYPGYGVCVIKFIVASVKSFIC